MFTMVSYWWLWLTMGACGWLSLTIVYLNTWMAMVDHGWQCLIMTMWDNGWSWPRAWAWMRYCAPQSLCHIIEISRGCVALQCTSTFTLHFDIRQWFWHKMMLMKVDVALWYPLMTMWHWNIHQSWCHIAKKIMVLTQNDAYESWCCIVISINDNVTLEHSSKLMSHCNKNNGYVTLLRHECIHCNMSQNNVFLTLWYSSKLTCINVYIAMQHETMSLSHYEVHQGLCHILIHNGT